MSFLIVRFEVLLQKAERVDPRAAALADRGSLLGFSHGDFLEHGRKQKFHRFAPPMDLMSPP